MTDNQLDPKDTFAKFGQGYQEKVVQAVLTDYLFAEQMNDVLDPKFMELDYLQSVTDKFFSYKREYKTYPSVELLEMMLVKDDPSMTSILAKQIETFLRQCRDRPLNGDTGYIQTSSLDFCKKQILKEAIMKSIDRIEDSDYDSIQTIIRDAMAKGGTRDIGHEYNEGFSSRTQKSIRKPIPTGWPILDREFNGGWERQILVTFIAPTGTGKSMFLVNCGAAALQQGLNVLYVTLEMADYKIGLRFDSYFSGIEINSVPDQQAKVLADVKSKALGNLWIKEFATKTATVQTIRAYIQRLKATKNFTPDMLVLDYADLLRSSRSHVDSRFELASVYEELRALSQEMNIVVITADQTNRSGLEMEVVTIAQIGESYAKAQICDVIMTISRRMEDKQANCGRLFVAKSRLGRDGMVFPFTMNTATVKATLLETGVDPVAEFMRKNENLRETAHTRYAAYKKSINEEK